MLLFKVFDRYYPAADGMSQSAPGYPQGHIYRRTYNDNTLSLHPSREKGQKSSFQRLTNLTSDMRKNKSR